MGFGVPLDHWFRHEMRDFAREVLFDPQTQSRGFFRPKAVEQLFDDHVSGRADHSPRLWSLLVLELWQRMGEVGKSPCVLRPASPTTLFCTQTRKSPAKRPPPLSLPADSAVYADYAQYSLNAEGNACRCTEVSILYALKTCPKPLEWP